MRGFDQTRMAITVNGIPQNDPEIHNVFWLNMPDLAANLEAIQVQRGAGHANYGTPAIGGSVNLVTANYANEPMVKLTTGLGFQQFTDNNDETIFASNIEKYSIEVSSGLIDNYAIYARLSSLQSKGYRQLTSVDAQSFFVSAVRFDSTLTSQINIFGGPIQDGLAYTGVPKAYLDDNELRRTNCNTWY
jgi:iron complex outermembrane receptor protein